MFNILMWQWFGADGEIYDSCRPDTAEQGEIIKFSYFKEQNFMHYGVKHLIANIGSFLLMAIVFEAKFGSLMCFIVYWSWLIISHQSSGLRGRSSSGTTYALFGGVMFLQITQILKLMAAKVPHFNLKNVLSVFHYWTQCVLIITIHQSVAYFRGNTFNAMYSDGIFVGITIGMVFFPLFDAMCDYNRRGRKLKWNEWKFKYQWLHVAMAIVGFVLLLLYLKFPVKLHQSNQDIFEEDREHRERIERMKNRKEELLNLYKKDGRYRN